ncbi:MAG TPA: asparagine synthase (glutamine-hydrolyzing) [Saprospiraceae bacterium]|jgi:asparagine synthase (glutamine-hydrolysing)|nr:asparagine synthase (glutamine-hydrolyzing) [Saprospiraceae bacterium]HRP40800.1 asparagine synthase (glutamine-hydrolyzing) [Saprospiraceae bacterium]
MCGITGILHAQHTELVTKMTQVIAHRGPDDFGYYHDEIISLGHRRLSIQDLSQNGHQPMFTADQRYVIVFNGEIYNHWDIRKDIVHKYPFKSSSDTETILYGFVEYGINILNKLNGIFAFAILDTFEMELTIVRDQFGVKPLYYYHDNNVMGFASELKSLLQIPDMDKNISLENLANYLYFLWSPGASTPFKNVEKLLPGHYIQMNVNDQSSFKIEKYYEIPFTGNYIRLTEKEWVNKLESALLKAVEMQMLSDVNIGFFLSGGLDSSLILAMAKKIHPDKTFNCYTIGCLKESKKEGFADDLPYANKVAKHLNLPLTIVKADINILKDFDQMIYHLDEPQSDAAPLNVWNICKQAREKGDIVLLGGTGGDDLFSGYRRHQWLYFDNKLNLIPVPIKLFLKSLSYILPGYAIKRRIQKFFGIYKFDNKTDQLASLYGWLDIGQINKLFISNLKKFDPGAILKNSLNSIPGEKNRLNQMLFWELKYFLPDHNLNYTDKMSMAYGVEVRVPFLDKDLVELSCQIPPELKMKGKETKYLLKKVAERYLPKDVIYRPKTGFGAPVRDWVTQDLSSMIDISFSKQNHEKTGIFKPEAINQLVSDNKKGYVDASYSVWSLLAIKSWINQFI